MNYHQYKENAKTNSVTITEEQFVDISVKALHSLPEEIVGNPAVFYDHWACSGGNMPDDFPFRKCREKGGLKKTKKEDRIYCTCSKCNKPYSYDKKIGYEFGNLCRKCAKRKGK